MYILNNEKIPVNTINDICESYGIDISGVEKVLEKQLGFKDDFKNMISLINNGDYNELFRMLISYIKDELFDAEIYNKNFMLTLIAFSMICFITNTVCTSNFRPDVKYTNITLAGILLYFFCNIYTLVYETLISVFEIMKSVLPVYLGALMVSDINRVLRTVLVLFVTGFHFLSNSILLPSVLVSMIIYVINSVGDIYYLKVNSIIISTVNWIIGIYTALHLTFIKLLGMNSISKNTLLYDGLRYTLSKGIPVVGGYVSDTLSTFIGGLGVLSQHLGYTASVIIISCSLIPFITTMFTGAVLKIVGSIYYVFADKTTSDLINNISLCIIELGVILILCIVGFVGSFMFVLE